MGFSKIELGFYLFITALAALLVLNIFSPYFYAIVVAATLAIVFEPVHRWIKRAIRSRSRAFAAFLSVIIILGIVLTPLFFMAVEVFEETISLYGQLATRRTLPLPTDIVHVVERFLPTVNVRELSLNLAGYASELLGWIFQNLGGVFSGIARVFMNIVLGLVALYYFLKDGDRIRASLVQRLPIPDKYADEILAKIEVAVSSVVRGALVVAIVQGLLAGIGYYFFGIPSPALWALLTMIASLVPFVGTTLVTIPAIIYLLAVGNGFGGIGLAIWALGLVGLVDNILRPMLLQHDVSIHPLLVFLSVLGGVRFFGPAGFLLGPVALSLFFALLDIYPLVAQDDRPAA